MIRYLIDRNGSKYSKAEAKANAFEIGFTTGYVNAILNGESYWDGMVHVTNLNGCPRQSALKYTHEYDVELDSASNLLIGTSMHNAFDTGHNEIRMVYDQLISGTLDEVDPLDDGAAIIDYKVVKSFHVKKSLGIVSVDVEVLDEYGNAVYFKSGKRAGQVKTRKENIHDPSQADLYSHIQQLNTYKFLWDHGEIIGNVDPEIVGRDVKKLIIFFLLKDGGGDAAKNLIQFNTYQVPIPIIEDEEGFIANKIRTAEQIYNYVEGITLNPPPIPENKKAIWDGRMCQSYCPVKHICKPDFLEE